MSLPNSGEISVKIQRLSLMYGLVAISSKRFTAIRLELVSKAVLNSTALKRKK